MKGFARYSSVSGMYGKDSVRLQLHRGLEIGLPGWGGWKTVGGGHEVAYVKEMACHLLGQFTSK